MGELNNVMGGMELGFSPIEDVSSIFEGSTSIVDNDTQVTKTDTTVDDKSPVDKKEFKAPSLNEGDASELFNNDNTDITDVDPKGIFGKQEVVGGEQVNIDESKDKGSDSDVNKGEGTSSPAQSQIYSAALALLKEQGALPSLDESIINTVDNPDAFSEVIQKQIEEKANELFDEDTKRIKEALDSGVEPDEIKYYENVTKSLESIDDASIEDDTTAGESLRRDLIMQDFINRGFSPERAKREADKAISNGTDIEDAKEALESNKDYFKSKYNVILEESRKEAEKLKAKYEETIKDFKSKVDSTNEFLSGIKIDASTKTKIKDVALKPIHKTEDGRVLSEVQKYIAENPVEAQLAFSTLYVLTNGFKDTAKVGKTVTKRATSEAAKQLAAALTNTNSDTSARFNNPFDVGSNAPTKRGYTIALD